MVIMNTKQYLGQLSRIESSIEFKIKEIDRLRALATNIASSQGDGMNVQRTRSFDKMGDTVAKIVDMQTAIDKMTDNLLSKRDRIIKQIDGLENNDHYNILMWRYMNDISFGEISSHLDKSESYTKKLHSDALKEFERKYGHTYMRKNTK